MYRYDAAMRLDWARVSSTQDGVTRDLDTAYDRYGNMLSQVVSPSGGPAGLAFSNRTYTNNRISDANFAYDANGNLTTEPAHEGVGGYRYGFTPENQIVQARNLTEGRILEASQYDSGGNRWARTLWADGGRGLITIRDGSGKVASEYVERSSATGMDLVKHYVYANDRLLAVNSACGPRPVLEPGNPPKVPPYVMFRKTDFVAPKRDYTIFIESESGQRKTLSRLSDLTDTFGILETEFFPNETNWVYIEADAECGHTGYSNGVSYKFTPTPGGPSCLQAMAAGRNSINPDGSSAMKLAAVGDCVAGTHYRAYLLREGTSTPVRISPVEPLPSPSFVIPNQPAGAGHGQYWFTPLDSVTNQEMAAGPSVVFDDRNEKPNPSQPSAAPSVNAQYVHWDHLGSTRLMTDEKGIEVGHWKFYPFGLEAETAGGADNRMKFTGHERDGELGLDYMLARYYSASLPQFLSVDPGNDTSPENPQSWNRYVYASNNPLLFWDPNGQDSYICVRPLSFPALGGIVGHEFVVHGATALGESGTVRSFGDIGSDRLGEVNSSTTGFSDTTSTTDQAAWDSLGTDNPMEGAACEPIPATDATVAAVANGVVSGVTEYSMMPGIQGGANSNSAATAIAYRASTAAGGTPPQSPGRLLTPGTGQSAVGRVKFSAGTPGKPPEPAALPKAQDNVHR